MYLHSHLLVNMFLNLAHDSQIICAVMPTGKKCLLEICALLYEKFTTVFEAAPIIQLTSCAIVYTPIQNNRVNCAGHCVTDKSPFFVFHFGCSV